MLDRPLSFTPEAIHDADRLTADFVRVVLPVADYYAARIAATLGLAAADVDDVRQDLLLEAVRRAGRFDPDRAALTTFVEMILRHASDEVAGRWTMWKRHHGGSLDREVDGPDGERVPLGEAVAEEHGIAARWAGCRDPFMMVEQRLDLESFANTLPKRLRRLCRLLQEEDGVADAQRLSGMSMADFYRSLQELRMRLRSVGLGPARRRGGPREKNRQVDQYIEREGTHALHHERPNR